MRGGGKPPPYCSTEQLAKLQFIQNRQYYRSPAGQMVASGKQVIYAVPIEHNSQLIVFFVKIVIAFVQKILYNNDA